MTTTALSPPGAVPTNGSGDPFTTTPTHAQPPLRYAAFDHDQFSSYLTNSPTSAKRALEAHLRDTDRRIQDASRLGSTLVQQRKELAARLTEVQQVENEDDIPEELHQRLADLEREYNELGRESARAFLPKSRLSIDGHSDVTASPAVLTTRSGESPTKLAAPSRRQRNQPSSRVHDIEFATEISASLLAQVRQLQAALAEKDGALKDATAMQAQLESETTNLGQRLRHMDEIEQKYKDENWNLETRLQELEGNFKESMDKEARLTQTLKSTQTDTASKERELDDLKVAHDKLNDEHAMAKKVQEADLHTLRRDVANREGETQKLYKKIEELTTQNGELAKAVSYRWSQGTFQSDTDFVSAEEGLNSDEQSPEHSPSASPIKGTPARHGVLESETLKSSLNHAHRMIQNLKNNIHREKTEKIELKRMLQDARDELETRRGDGGAMTANLTKRRKNESDNGKFKKPARPDRLGATRNGTTEIIEDEPNWEDDEEDEHTPSKSSGLALAAVGSGFASAGARHAFSDDTESTDAFETANERETTTESEAFQTGAEDFSQDSDGDLTETEGGLHRSSAMKGISNQRGNRSSFLSTASTSAGEEEDDDDFLKTPERNPQQTKYRLRMNRGARRSDRVADLVTESPNNQSPASSFGTPQHDQPMQSLGDELDALDDDSIEGTPASVRTIDSDALDDTPATQRHISVDPDSPSKPPRESSPPVTDHDRQSVIFHRDDTVFDSPPPVVKAPMVDAGIMTDPWEPERIVEKQVVPEVQKDSFRDRASDLIGGALAGFGLSRATSKHDQPSVDTAAQLPDKTNAQQPDPVREHIAEDGLPPPSEVSPLQDKFTTPAEPSREAPLPPLKPQLLTFSYVLSQEYEPSALPSPAMAPLVAKPSSTELHAMYVAGQTMSQDQEIGARNDQVPGLVPAIPIMDSKSAEQEFATPQTDARETSKETAAGAAQRDVFASHETTVLIPTPAEPKRPVSDEGSQTLVSSRDIDNMLRTINAPKIISPETLGTVSSAQTAAESGFVGAAAGTLTLAAAAKARRQSIDSNHLSDVATKAQRRSIDSNHVNEAAPLRAPRRPGSAGSVRSKTAPDAPPLPPDHTQKIAAAAQQRPTTPSATTNGTMGPPLLPASAYRSPRPKTPAERILERGASREGTTPRPMRLKENRAGASSPAVTASRRTSMSSFASELDERFNINRGQIMYPHDVEPATDPRMIQAITQTMIGEYLWKYTRKAGRSETSNTRHRRFFWVHPYTRTLYWSEQDPSTAGKNMLKAKSVAIDAVRIVTDDNAFPPGLHRKSLVVVTPGRDIVFTAPTGQRHETWFNALSYLLLRTEQEKEEAQDTFNEALPEDSNAGIVTRARRSLSKAAATGRGRSSSRVSGASLSSYNSRTTRNSSAHRANATKAQKDRRVSAANRAEDDVEQTQQGTHDSGTIRASKQRESNSVSARFSSIASRFRASSRARSSVGGPGITGDPAQIYDASVVSDSAEDLRAVIEQQERDADRLENVRACCDGKHDVGSLSRNQRHSSLGARFSTHAHGSVRPRS